MLKFLFSIRDNGLVRYDLRVPTRVRRSASLDSSRSRDKHLNVPNKNNEESFRLSKTGSFKRFLHVPTPRAFANRQLSSSINSNNAPLASHEDDGTPPKMLRFRYSSGSENDSGNKSLFYKNQLSDLLNGIINDSHISERDRHDKLMKVKINFIQGDQK
jgi:hypothetical protein